MYVRVCIFKNVTNMKECLFKMLLPGLAFLTANVKYLLTENSLLFLFGAATYLHLYSVAYKHSLQLLLRNWGLGRGGSSCLQNSPSTELGTGRRTSCPALSLVQHSCSLTFLLLPILCSVKLLSRTECRCHLLVELSVRKLLEEQNSSSQSAKINLCS